eukprot:1985342-Lingulodinium_polyedra.AAC.1
MGRALPGAPGEGLQPRDETISHPFLWISLPPHACGGDRSGTDTHFARESPRVVRLAVAFARSFLEAG